MIDIINAIEYPPDEEMESLPKVTVEAIVDGVHCTIGGLDKEWTKEQIRQHIEERKNEIIKTAQENAASQPRVRNDLLDITPRDIWQELDELKTRVDGIEDKE